MKTQLRNFESVTSNSILFSNIIVLFNEYPNVFSIKYFLKLNVDPFRDITDDITKLVDVRHKNTSCLA